MVAERSRSFTFGLQISCLRQTHIQGRDANSALAITQVWYLSLTDSGRRIYYQSKSSALFPSGGLILSINSLEPTALAGLIDRRSAAKLSFA